MWWDLRVSFDWYLVVFVVRLCCCWCLFLSVRCLSCWMCRLDCVMFVVLCCLNLLVCLMWLLWVVSLMFEVMSLYLLNLCELWRYEMDLLGGCIRGMFGSVLWVLLLIWCCGFGLLGCLLLCCLCVGVLCLWLFVCFCFRWLGL